MDVGVELQKAVIAALRADATLGGMLGGTGSSMRLYDAPPAEPTYPFARIGSVETRPEDEDGMTGHVVTMGLEAADRPAGRGAAVSRSMATEIAGGFADVIHRRETALNRLLTAGTAWSIVEARYETMSVEVEAENLTYVVVAVFTFLIS